MSLLLQALQKAARSRETGPDEAPAASAPEPVQEPSFDFDAAGVEDAPGSSELTLADDADLFETEPDTDPRPEPILPAATRPGIGRARSAAFGADASAEQAATILRASEERGTGWFDWVRDRPVHTFAIVAGIFLLFYFVYVYLQIFHPAILRGDFLNKPALKARTPAPPPTPISKAPEPAPAATLPDPAATPAAPVETGTGTVPPSSGTPANKPIAGLPQAPAAASPEAKVPAAASAERSKPLADEPPRAKPGPRVTRQPPSRREFLAEAPAAALEDTVAVRQPEAPATTSATLMQAWEALQRGQYTEAEALYEKVAQAEPYNVDAVLGLAALASQRANSELAIRHYTRALELEPRNPTAQAGLISLLGQADPQLSESRLKELIAREPSANLYFALGNLYARMTQWAQAQQAYFQAYQLQPDNPDYAYNLAVGLEHLSQPKLALTYYRQALELGKVRGHAGFDSARVEERIGQLAARTGND
jgi:Flp pilus assembly protein TadD